MTERILTEIPQITIQRIPFRTRLVETIANRHPGTEVQGAENIREIKRLLDSKVPVIGIFNHLSHLDAPLIAIEFNKVEPGVKELQVFIMGSVIWKNLITHFLMQAYDGIMVPSHRQTPAKEDGQSWGIRMQWKEKADEAAARALQEGKFLLLSPEGGRSKDGTGLKQPSDHAARYFYFAQNIHLVPIAVWNTERFLPPEKFFPRPWHRPHISVGPIFSMSELEQRITPSEKPEENNQKLVDAIMIEVARLLPEEYRGYYALSS